MHAFDVLGDPVRRRILELLADGEHSSGDVVAVVQGEFGITQSAVSQHLKVLRDSGFATVRIDGPRRLYAIERQRRSPRSTPGWTASGCSGRRGSRRWPPRSPAARSGGLERSSELRLVRRRRSRVRRAGRGIGRGLGRPARTLRPGGLGGGPRRAPGFWSSSRFRRLSVSGVGMGLSGG